MVATAMARTVAVSGRGTNQARSGRRLLNAIRSQQTALPEVALETLGDKILEAIVGRCNFWPGGFR